MSNTTTLVDKEVEQRIENPEEIWIGIDGQYNLTLSETLALVEWWEKKGSKNASIRTD